MPKKKLKMIAYHGTLKRGLLRSKNCGIIPFLLRPNATREAEVV